MKFRRTLVAVTTSVVVALVVLALSAGGSAQPPMPQGSQPPFDTQRQNVGADAPELPGLPREML